MKSKSKKVRVDREFLLNLANDIYNSRNRTFLRLCNGKLQNGPDPTNKKRTMHCGLGELYFAMTGLQPEMTGVSEKDVVDLAVELSPLNGLREKRDREAHANLDAALNAIRKMNISETLKETFIYNIDDEKEAIDNVEDDDRDDEESSFRETLDAIPDENDDDYCNDECDAAIYRERSKRVAAMLKKAASYLPR